METTATVAGFPEHSSGEASRVRNDSSIVVVSLNLQAALWPRSRPPARTPVRPSSCTYDLVSAVVDRSRM